MSKKIIPIVLLISTIFVISLGAFTNTSFRNASTATLLEDDYDMWLGPYPLPDPARLPLIDGARLYTNLSNLVNKAEEPFGTFSSDYFLIGGSTNPLFNFGNLGFVVDRYNDKNPWDTGLLDRLGNPIYGFGDVVSATLTDDDGNGTYDRRTEVEETRETWQDQGNKDFVFGFGKDMNGSLFGLFFQMNKMKTETYGAPGGMPVNYTLDSTDINLVSGDRTFTESRLGTGSTIDDMTLNTFGLSFWKYLSETRAVGFHFGYGMLSATSDDIWDNTDNWNASPDDASITDTYSMRETSDENIPYSGNDITGWLSFISDFNEITHFRFDTYFEKASSKVGSDAVRNYTFVDNRIAADNHTDATNGTEATGITGDGSYQTVAIQGKFIYDLSDNVNFAFGIGFSTNTWDTTRVEINDSRYVQTYDDGDNEVNDPDDYTETTTYASEIQTKTTEGSKIITFPVCVEFHVKTPLVFRLGAIHSINLTESTTNMDLLSASPGLVHTVYGDGSISDVLINNPGIQDIGSSEDNTDTYSNTNYTYGMGYAVGKNLKIDLMGFSDLTNLSNWKVSATLMF